MPKLVYRIIEGGYKDDEVSDVIYIVTPDRTIVVLLDDDDGYRSYLTVLPHGEYDEIDVFIKMSAPQSLKERTTIRYTRIEYDVEKDIGYNDDKSVDTHGGCENTLWLVRAFRGKKLVFEIGTANHDDYYPNFFVWSEKGKEEDNRGYTGY